MALAEVAYSSAPADQWVDVQCFRGLCGEYEPSTILEIGQKKITV
jgi:hypothetical protein